MKHLVLSFFALLFFTFSASAQAPQAFKYQTVVRDAAGQVLANKSVTLRTDLEQNGNPVYQETHYVTTNAFGLINLAIGRGTVNLGQFDTVDWSIPTYVHISLDGMSMGQSELLSVPYALYAANADGDADTDPTNELEMPANLEKGDLAYHDGAAWQRIPAGAPGSVLTMGDDGLPAWKALPSLLDSLLKVTMTNGNVIYVSPVDNHPPGGIEWGAQGTDITALTNIGDAATANMDFSGTANTAAIVAQLGDNGGTAYAAKVCADLEAYGFDDWYLPATGELGEMYKKLGPVANGGSGQITTNYYWSSSEQTGVYAWVQGFAGSGNPATGSKSGAGKCRCVRK